MMFLYVRRALLLSIAASLVACSGANGGGATPSAFSGSGAVANATGASADALSAQTAMAALAAAPEVAGGRVVIRNLSMHPNAASSAILMNFVSDGPAQGGVPCISCVNGAQSNDNIGLTGPSSYIPKGATWQYTLSFTDIKFKGMCKLSWAITSGQKTIDSFSASLRLTSFGGFVLYGLNRTRPTYSGAATLTGKVTCGVHNQMTSAPLEFQ